MISLAYAFLCLVLGWFMKALLLPKPVKTFFDFLKKYFDLINCLILLPISCKIKTMSTLSSHFIFIHPFSLSLLSLFCLHSVFPLMLWKQLLMNLDLVLERILLME